MLKRTLMIAFILILGACSIGPDYQRPEFNLPKSFTNTPLDQGIVKSDASELDLRWWRSFKDPLLSELIESGVSNNLSVKQALSRINQSRALARKAFSELLPGALLNGDYRKAEEPGARFPGGGGTFRYELYTASADAVWELDLFGRLRRELESKNEDYAGREAELEDMMRIVSAEIAKSYIELRASQEQLWIAKRNAKVQRNSLGLVQTKFKYGEVSELEPARAKSQLAQTESLIPTLDAAVKIHMHRIAVLIGKQPASLYSKLQAIEAIPEYAGPVSISAPEQLLRNRPDVRAAEHALASKTAQIGVAIGELFPKLSISGSIGMAAPKFSDLQASNSFNSFGPSISWAALDTGRLRANVRFARQAAKESLYMYEAAVLACLEDVENSFLRLSSEKRRQSKLLEAETYSQKAYEIAASQYREGALDFLSVLVAQEDLLGRESDTIEGKKNLALALVGLYKAFGGGWVQES